MPKPAILVIDQGTSATKAFLFDKDLHQIHAERIQHTIQRPKPGWAEMDPRDVQDACWRLLLSLLSTCRSRSLAPAAIGMAFQRSTFLFWDRRNCRPLTPAMSWQDTRAREITDQLEEHGTWIQETTGIPLSPHFGGPKFLFSVQACPELKSSLQRGNVVFGPISSFVTHAVTGKPTIDESIAGRTLLFNLKQMAWDSSLLDLFDVPDGCLPELVPTCGDFGQVVLETETLPLVCVIGDQQASLIGQNHGRKGATALNFGTSGSVLVHSGESAIIVPALLSNVLYSSTNERNFLLEGTINGVGSLFRWLERYLGIPHEKMNWHERCSTSARGIVVPGVNGIATPYWTGEFETAFVGFSKQVSPNEIVRAAMESIGFLVNDIFALIRGEARIQLQDIVASGGSARPPLLQFIADLLDTTVWSTATRDMTALGVARLVAEQVWGKDRSQTEVQRDKAYSPAMKPEDRERKIQQWRRALGKLNILNQD